MKRRKSHSGGVDDSPRAADSQAERLAGRLKDRVLRTVVPQLANGFLDDRIRRLGKKGKPTDAELDTLFCATLTLFYRLLFLLYAESRDLLPVGERPYFAASLQKIREEIAERAGAAAGVVSECLAIAYSAEETSLYERLMRLFRVVDRGDRLLNVPAYRGRGRGRGALFDTLANKHESPYADCDGEDPIARFLIEHRVPDRHLAVAIDGLSRDADEQAAPRSLLDFKSLDVRQLGSIYETLLQFRLKVAADDLETRPARNGKRRGAAERDRQTGEFAVRRGELYLSNECGQRKSSGSYYTPEPIVEYIVANTVGPMLEEKLAALRTALQANDRELDLAELDPAERLLDLKVADPAAGSGHFLVKAADFITNRLLAFLDEFPTKPLARFLEGVRRKLLDSLAAQGVAVDPARLTDANLLKRQVVARCIYGVDLNPMAVELAKASLWLDAGAIGTPLDFLDARVRCGNSLLGGPLAERGPAIASRGDRAAELLRRSDLRFFQWEVEFPDVFLRSATEASADDGPFDTRLSGFDCVIGNPPYAGHKGDFDAAALTALFEVCRDYPNPATAFLEQSLRIVRPHGRVGMIVPKSIQYVASWDASRRLLANANRLLRVADVSQAFDGVLLEQTVCIAAREPATDGYVADTFGPNRGLTSRAIDGSIPRLLACLPANVDDRSLALFKRIVRVGPRLGEIAYTSQAFGYQAALNRDVTGACFPIYRGKQIRPMRIGEPSDFIDRSVLTRSRTEELIPKCREMLRPKVVSQNIVAHVTRPKPRAWVISAPDHAGILCLNTISTTIVRDARFPIDYVAAVLNSTLASWFYTEFVFCRAIRTMHFDNFYAGKLPIARPAAGDAGRFERLTEGIAAETPRAQRQCAIDDAVFEAYGLTLSERDFLYDYCYGTPDLAGVLRGF